MFIGTLVVWTSPYIMQAFFGVTGPDRAAAPYHRQEPRGRRQRGRATCIAWETCTDICMEVGIPQTMLASGRRFATHPHDADVTTACSELARFLANMNARVSPLQHERDRIISELERQRGEEQDPASFHGLAARA